MRRCLLAASVLVRARNNVAQASTPGSLLKPLGDSWPSYSGDLTGRRYSALTQINQTTVKNLGARLGRAGLDRRLRTTAGRPAVAVVAAGGGGGGGGADLSSAGEGTGEFNTGGPRSVRGSILMVDGMLYPTSPDNLWAVDARDGTMLWQFYWKTRGGTHTGHRGVGMWRNYLFMETHDNYLV